MAKHNHIDGDSDIAFFGAKLAVYRQQLDADIRTYSLQLQHTTLQRYGAEARLPLDSYLQILGRGGKRIRGALTLLGYELAGGRDRTVVAPAACAIEMLHAYLLVIDDIQDRSKLRRGGPAAHTQLAKHHQQHDMTGNAAHFGRALAIQAALLGAHQAQILLLELPIAGSKRLEASQLVQQTMVTTLHGQTNDIMNQVTNAVDQAQIDRVLIWKTACYSFLTPLHLGILLADADAAQWPAIQPYALHAGKAFQISDDILGTFQAARHTGKNPLDDIREGKRTILSTAALQRSGSVDRAFLHQMLGNRRLTVDEFERCKTIMRNNGALDFAQQQLRSSAQRAIVALERDPLPVLDVQRFLRGLAQYLMTRTS